MEAIVFTNPSEAMKSNLRLGRALGCGEIRVKKALSDGIQGGIRSIAYREDEPAKSQFAVYEHLGVVIEACEDVVTPEQGSWALKVIRTGGYEYGASGHSFVIDDASRWVAMPNTILDLASLVDPLAAASRAFAEIASMSERLPGAWANDPGTQERRKPRALVLGSGVRGLTAAMALLDGGFETVIAAEEGANGFDRIIAERIGAGWIAHEDRRTRNGSGAPFNVIYESCGDTPKALRIMDLLACDGVMIFGGCNNWLETPEIDIGRIMRNSLRNGQLILGSINPVPRSYEDAIHDLQRFVRRWPEAVRALASPRPASAAEESHDLLFCNAG